MKKRIIALVLTVVMAVGSMGVNSISAETALKEENLKKVLLQIKNKLEIGDEFTQFDYNYYENNQNNYWYFNWSDEEYKNSISVQCDDAGHILRYSKNSATNSSIIPELTKKEVEVKILEWIKQVEPEIADKLTVKSSYYSKYNNSYRFSFCRMENGIEMPDNSISITMTTDGKNVLQYSENWNYTVSIPDSKGIMTKDEAAAIIKQNVKMELQYRLGWDEEGNEYVFLAYSPDKYYISVNAKTGKVYTEKNYWNSDDEMFGESATDDGSSDKNDFNATLTPAEIEKAEDIKGLIPSEKAVQLIKENKYLYVDANVNAVNSQLSNINGRYIWNISLEDNRDFTDDEDDYYRAYAYAQLDAVTGEILQYYSSVKTEWVNSEEAINIKLNFTKKQCRDNFEEFVKTVIPEKFASVKLDTARKSYVIYADYATNTYKYGGYDFAYDRFNEGVPFYANGINGSVDAVTGKVYEFYYNWTDAKLPSTKGVIGESKAFDKYIAFEGFDLVYELVNNYKDKGSIYGYDVQTVARLVYRTAMESSLVDAFTGKALDYSGHEYVKKITVYDYNDIAGTKYERIIRLLADMGIGIAAEKFEPGKAITVEEFKDLLAQAGFGSYYPVYPVYPIYPVYNTFDGAVSTAKTSTLIAANKSDDSQTKLTRQNAAALIIEAMGSSKLASMDIFKTGFADEAKIDAANIGAVALVKGYGIMGAKSGNNFKPNAKLTRGEAAKIIFNLMTSEF